jgi:hypothetical protein
MAIETLDDLNQILGQCCCEMPECPLPTRECESATASIGDSGHHNVADTEWTLYSVLKYREEFTETYSDPDEEVSSSAFYELSYTWSSPWEGNIGTCYTWDSTEDSACSSEGTLVHQFYDTVDGVRDALNNTATVTRYNRSGDAIPDTDPVEYYADCTFEDIGVTDYVDPDEPDVETSLGFNNTSLGAFSVYGGTSVDLVLYEEGVSYAAWASAAIAEASLQLGQVDAECYTGIECESSTAQTVDPLPGDSSVAVTVIRSRFRWVIPDTWTGSYFKITWDVATYPTDPEAEISYVQDLTWEWTGPGDPEDADSWKSDWFEIDPPGDPGERKVVNIRYECYRSPRFGNKPQITGDAEDISDDVPLQYRFISDNHTINLLHL